MIFSLLESLLFRLNFIPGRIRILSKLLDVFKVHGLRTGRWTEGFRMECDLSFNFERAIYLGLYDLEELAVVQKLFKGSGTFIDCGANLGVYSMFAANQIRRNDCVIGIEPNPSIFKRFVRNVEINRFESFVQTRQAAISSERGSAILEIPTYTHTMASLNHEAAANAGADIEKREVPLVTIDDLAKDRLIEGMKIDIEGHELPALEGASKTLQNDKPWMLLEYNPSLATGSTLADWPVHQLLVDLGYQARLVNQLDDAPLESDWKAIGTTNLLYKYS
jgi:FkbM family methyltransferase